METNEKAATKEKPETHETEVETNEKAETEAKAETTEKAMKL